MKRINVDPRPNWQHHLEYDLDFTYHTVPNDENWQLDTYWNEEAFYLFSEKQVLTIEAAAKQCWNDYVAVTGNVIEGNRLDKLNIPAQLHPLIRKSWDRDDKSIIGRFDFSYDGVNPPKLLELNGDTPTSLYEAAIIQYEAKMARWGRNVDQFNWIHEALKESWDFMRKEEGMEEIHFTSYATPEDITNAVYAMRVAQEAGIKCDYLTIDELAFAPNEGILRNAKDETIKNLYKLYPWEYLTEELPPAIIDTQDNTRFIEPIWKMAMSTKAMLPLLHEYAPNSPYLLKAFFSRKAAKKKLDGNYVRKPFISREGAGVTIFEERKAVSEQQGAATDEGFVYQETAKLPEFKDAAQQAVHPVLGVWVIGGQVCGMGIRESGSLITNNRSKFVPHIFTKSGELKL